MNIQSFTVNPFQENSYILSDETNVCVVIDPGFSNNNEFAKLFQYIETNELKPVAIVNTHNHIDHVLGINRLRSRFYIPI